MEVTLTETGRLIDMSMSLMSAFFTLDYLPSILLLPSPSSYPLLAITLVSRHAPSPLLNPSFLPVNGTSSLLGGDHIPTYQVHHPRPPAPPPSIPHSSHPAPALRFYLPRPHSLSRSALRNPPCPPFLWSIRLKSTRFWTSAQIRSYPSLSLRPRVYDRGRHLLLPSASSLSLSSSPDPPLSRRSLFALLAPSLPPRP